VPDALDRVLAMTNHGLGQKIKVERDYRPAPRVLADPIGLAQVFLNLIMNAMQSLHATKRAGTLRVATYMNPEGEVVAEVEDDGAGVPAAIARRIFDPFFTTKPPGFTGLGLAVSHEIVRNLGGRLELVAGREVGALFRMTLPAAELRDDAEVAGAPKRLRVLIVEEEYGLLIALKRSLGDGFLVATERDAHTAFARMQRGERFDALVTSLLLTDPTVTQFFGSIHALDPAQARRVLFLTGLPISAEADALVERHIDQTVALSARQDEFQSVVRAAARR
jgi:hypothetical protein